MYLLACVILISGREGGSASFLGVEAGEGVCLQVYGQTPPQVCLRGEICIQRVGQTPPPPPRYMGYGQQASCTHPTGMLSCSILCSVQIVNESLHCVKSFVNASHAIGLNKELNKIFQNKKSFFSSTFIFIVLENIKFFSFL